MTCDQCKQDRTVTLEHGVKWGKVWIRWRECRECWAEQEKRAAKAIEQAERSGV